VVQTSDCIQCNSITPFSRFIEHSFRLNRQLRF
jgi:hypothetical protein